MGRHLHLFISLQIKGNGEPSEVWGQEAPAAIAIFGNLMNLADELKPFYTVLDRKLRKLMTAELKLI